MAFLLAVTIGGLNPDVEKNRFGSLLRQNKRNLYSNEIFLKDSLSDQFLLNHQIISCEEVVLNELNHLAKKNLEVLNGGKINSQIINNAYKIISALPPSFLYFIDNDSIYCSSFGTMIMDFKNGDNAFSLEIAKNSIGYFVELNGHDELIEDNVPIDNNNFEKTMTKLCHDFSIIL